MMYFDVTVLFLVNSIEKQDTPVENVKIGNWNTNSFNGFFTISNGILLKYLD